MNIVSKINSLNTFFLFTENNKEIEFTINDRVIKSNVTINEAQYKFICKTFGFKNTLVKDKKQVIEEIKQLKMMGETYREIAEKIGLSPSWCRELHIKNLTNN